MLLPWGMLLMDDLEFIKRLYYALANDSVFSRIGGFLPDNYQVKELMKLANNIRSKKESCQTKEIYFSIHKKQLLILDSLIALALKGEDGLLEKGIKQLNRAKNRMKTRKAGAVGFDNLSLKKQIKKMEPFVKVAELIIKGMSQQKATEKIKLDQKTYRDFRKKILNSIEILVVSPEQCIVEKYNGMERMQDALAFHFSQPKVRKIMKIEREAMYPNSFDAIYENYKLLKE